MKKILFHSDFSKLKTGFGRNAREVLMHLWKTGKYDIVEYACGPVAHGSPALKQVPWKCYGSIPTKSYHLQAVESPSLQQKTRYGGFFIDDIIASEKPDVYIGVNDFWGFDGYYNKPWWNKFPCVLWITMDSLPLLPNAVKNADKIENFWMWASFAEKEFHRLGHKHVKTVHGALDVETFKPLVPASKIALKKQFKLEGQQVFGFVFRNQLRKLVPSLLEGFKKYQQAENYKPSKILLHTNWAEGWNIPQFIDEFELDPEDVLTTFYCKRCKHFHVSAFESVQKDCPHCGGGGTCITPNVEVGVTSEQLNLIYNLMDFYIHPITSGGLEMPIVEALMAGLPAATVDYSCGSEFCDSGLVKKIGFSTYRELSTGFIKASTSSESIATIMGEFSDMDKKEYQELSDAGRLWAHGKFDSKKICKNIETFLDCLPESDYSYEFEIQKHNDGASFEIDEEESDEDWSVRVIKEIFDADEPAQGATIKSMCKEIENHGRQTIFDKALSSARDHNKRIDQANVPAMFSQSENCNIGFVSPENQIEKVFSLPILESVYKQTGKNVIIISDPIDPALYSPLSFVKGFVPKGPRSLNLDWLLDLRDDDDTPRFDLILFQNGNEYTYQEQDTDGV